MVFEYICSFVSGLFFSIVTGVYAGLVVSRFMKFEDVRAKVREVFHRVEYINNGDGGKYVVTVPDSYRDLTLYSFDLFSLGHKRAGDDVNSLRDSISDTVQNPHQDTGDVNDFNEVWYRMVRGMKPSFRVLFDLRFKV